MTINDRIKFVRKSLGLNQTDFGKRIAVSQGYQTNIENGQRDVTEKILRLVCFEFGVNEKWLRTGEGDMHAPKSDGLPEALCEKYHLPNTALSILNTFLSMDEKSRSTILDFTHRLAANLLENNYESLRPYLVSGESVPGLHAARGGGMMPLELDSRAGAELEAIPESEDDI